MRINFATTQDAAFWKKYARAGAADVSGARSQHLVGRERPEHVHQQLAAWCWRRARWSRPGTARRAARASSSSPSSQLEPVGAVREAVLDQPRAPRCASAALRITQRRPRCSSAASAGPGSSSRSPRAGRSMITALECRLAREVPLLEPPTPLPSQAAAAAAAAAAEPEPISPPRLGIGAHLVQLDAHGQQVACGSARSRHARPARRWRPANW